MTLELVYFLALLAILFFIIEIVTVIFKITGLNEKKARYQVISIITHTGFTTRESELVTQHPLRRKIASYLMILSYVAQVTLISILFRLLQPGSGAGFDLVIIFIVLIVTIIFFTRNKYVISKLDNLLEKYILRQMKVNRKYRTIDEVLKLNEDFAVSEIILEEKSPLFNAE